MELRVTLLLSSIDEGFTIRRVSAWIAWHIVCGNRLFHYSYSSSRKQDVGQGISVMLWLSRTYEGFIVRHVPRWLAWHIAYSISGTSLLHLHSARKRVERECSAENLYRNIITSSRPHVHEQSSKSRLQSWMELHTHTQYCYKVQSQKVQRS